MSVIVERRGILVTAVTAMMLACLSANAFVGERADEQLVWMMAILPMFVVGAVLVLRAPSSAVGWLLFAAGALGSTGSLQGLTALDGWLAATGAGLSTAGVALLPLVLLIFPDGSLPSPRWRIARAGMIATAVLGASAGFLVGGWGGDPEGASVFSPLYESTRAFTPIASNVFFPAFALSVAPALASLFMRYRRASDEVRQQLKWLLVGVGFVGAVLAAMASGGEFASATPSGWRTPALAAGMGSVPAAIGVAVLRYRLYDIDIVISRAVTYGALAVFIGAVYVGVVVGIGELIGQGDRASFTLSIIATALVAIAFQPVRRWVQRGANRLVYGERATPYEVLAQFTRRVAEESDEEALRRIPRLIVDGTGASEAALWVRSDNGFRTAFTWPEEPAARRIVGDAGFTDPDGDYSLPVFHDGELLGGISLVKARGDTITPAEEELLHGLAGGMGLSLRNAQLTSRLRRQVADLERSRDRVVVAADEARRSLEHDLDSGPQQQLVALKVKLGPVRKMAEQAGAEKTAHVLVQLEEAAGGAIRSIRDFAAGIYPPLLEAEGLEVALRQQARKAAVPVRVDSAGVGRYPREVEAAVYFTVLEALQNTTKYADASAATVTIGEAGDVLTLAVRDDGVGFDPEGVPAGAGLANMADRLDAVGGRCTIESASGKGTTVTGSVPVRALEPAGV